MSDIPDKALEASRLRRHDVVNWTAYNDDIGGGWAFVIFAPFLAILTFQLVFVLFFLFAVNTMFSNRSSGFYMDDESNSYQFSPIQLFMSIIPLLMLAMILRGMSTPYRVFLAAQSQYWILTETELKVVVLDHDTTCFPNCCRSGDLVKTIPLEQITDCGVSTRGGHCTPVDVIYVDTASSGARRTRKSMDEMIMSSEHEAEGVAMLDCHEFMDHVMQQRDDVRGYSRSSRPAHSRSKDNKPTKRMDELQSMYDSGYISMEEFEHKRQIILSLV